MNADDIANLSPEAKEMELALSQIRGYCREYDISGSLAITMFELGAAARYHLVKHADPEELVQSALSGYPEFRSSEAGEKT